MKYQDMLDTLAGMSEQERTATISAHWQAVFSDGFIGFVQGQVEAGRAAILPGSQARQLLSDAGLPDAMMLPYFEQQLHKALSVWHSMRSTYERLQAHSAQQGNRGGMVDHGHHTSMPAGMAVTAAGRCYRCGSPVSADGLCSGCLDTKADWEQQDLEYDRQRYNQQQDLQDYQRLQDDQIYYDNQMDFNSYQDY